MTTSNPASDEAPIATARAGPASAGRAARTTRAVVLYKSARAVVAFALAFLLGLSAATGASAGVGAAIERHATPALLRLATHVGGHSGTRTLLVALLVADGLWCTLEAWALHRGFPWSRWLVVIATGVPLPFEVVAIAAHASWARGAIFLANAAVVAALVRSRGSCQS